jgi:hypothetical protein
MALGGTVHSPYLRARQQYPSVKHMLTATCHCGLVRIEIPNAPEKVTSCNCSICRRLGVLWGYYDVDQVNVVGHPENTDEYIQGDKTLRIVRCRTCGCTTHWEPLDPVRQPKMAVNIRNFEPDSMKDIQIRLFDGADTWKFIG